MKRIWILFGVLGTIGLIVVLATVLHRSFNGDTIGAVFALSNWTISTIMMAIIASVILTFIRLLARNVRSR